MIDTRVSALSKTIIKKGTGLETPNYGTSCKGDGLSHIFRFI